MGQAGFDDRAATIEVRYAIENMLKKPKKRRKTDENGQKTDRKTAQKRRKTVGGAGRPQTFRTLELAGSSDGLTDEIASYRRTV